MLQLPVPALDRPFLCMHETLNGINTMYKAQVSIHNRPVTKLVAHAGAASGSG